MTLVNFGSGPHKLPGFVNVDLDRRAVPTSSPTCRAGCRSPTPAPTRSSPRTSSRSSSPTRSALPRRVPAHAQAGGTLRVLTPDLKRFMRMYLDEPERLMRFWNDAVGVPLPNATAATSSTSA
jgi:hypothetical protein